MLIVTSIS